jgi:hypothetical protein
MATLGPLRLRRSCAREDLAYEFVELPLRAAESSPPGWGEVVVLPDLPVHHLPVLAQVALSLQAVQDGIEGPGPDPVAVACQLHHERDPEDRRLGGMEQNVDANESQEQFAEQRQASVLNSDIEYGYYSEPKTGSSDN